MKFVYTLIPLLILSTIFFGCMFKRGNISGIRETGGAYDYSKKLAPKTIKSKEIISFEYSFPISGLGEWAIRKIPLTYCTFTLIRNGEEALCTGEGRYHSEIEFDFDFNTDFSALEKLQFLVDEYNLATVNGIDKGSHGIPEDFNSRLKVLYESEEKIFAADNSGSILSDQANIAIYDFFMKLAKEVGEMIPLFP